MHPVSDMHKRPKLHNHMYTDLANHGIQKVSPLKQTWKTTTSAYECTVGLCACLLLTALPDMLNGSGRPDHVTIPWAIPAGSDH